MSENKAFEKLFHKEVTEKIAGTRIGNLNWGDMRFAFQAGQRQMNERCVEIANDEKIYWQQGEGVVAAESIIKNIHKDLKP